MAALTRRLDGLPLALELAAARTRVLSPAELLARLDRLGLGAIDPVVGDERRSMAAIIDWTLGLLDGDQADVIRAGAACEGFDVALLEAILEGRDVVDPLEHLVALGLVVHLGSHIRDHAVPPARTDPRTRATAAPRRTPRRCWASLTPRPS